MEKKLILLMLTVKPSKSFIPSLLAQESEAVYHLRIVALMRIMHLYAKN
jgi:hypothetical protein